MNRRDEPIGAPASSAPDRSAGSAEMVIQGWSSMLAIIVTSLLLVQSLTGIWLFFAPFSLSSQLQLLLHVGAGLLMLVPYAVYQTWHLWAWGTQKATAVMVLGYLLMVLVLVCVVSGLVLTWQSWFGPRIGQTWHLIHLVSGFAALALVAVHLPLALIRRRHLAAATPRFRRGVRRHVAGVLGSVLASAAVIGLVAGAWPAGPGTYPPPEDYTLPEYAALSDEYRGSPFAPSNARTAGDLLIDPALLSNSQSCGVSGCHELIYAEWEPSAHRFSAMNAPFQAVQREFAAQRGAAETRYCAGCHDPISLFAGSKDIHELSLSAPGMQEGCSCIVCHSIDQVDQRGNADYVLVPPQPYLWEHETGWRKAVSNFLIRAYPRQHLADYDGDGRVDLAISVNRGPVLLLRNETATEYSGLKIRLRGPAAACFGAKVELIIGTCRQYRWWGADVSYLSGHAPELIFGLGEHLQADRVQVTWSDERISVLSDVPAGKLVVDWARSGSQRGRESFSAND